MPNCADAIRGVILNRCIPEGEIEMSIKSQTIPAAAKKLKPLMSEGQLRRAIKRKQVKTVPFGGLRRVTDAEIERVRALLQAGSEETEATEPAE